MNKVLVTGGTGVLGREIVPELGRLGKEAVVLSHRKSSGHCYGDLLTGEGLTAALQGVDVVIHAATSIKATEEIEMTSRMVNAARQVGVQHFIFVSIAGIDRVGGYDYYRAKLAGEQLVSRSGLPFTIQRATQFHQFVAHLLGILCVGPLQIAPSRTRLQPVEVGAAGRAVAALALERPQGYVRDLAGPQVLDFETLARTSQQVRGGEGLIVPFPVPHPAFRAMRTGQLVPASPRIVGETWESWLAEGDSRKNPYQRPAGG